MDHLADEIEKLVRSTPGLTDLAWLERCTTALAPGTGSFLAVVASSQRAALSGMDGAAGSGHSPTTRGRAGRSGRQELGFQPLQRIPADGFVRQLRAQLRVFSGWGSRCPGRRSSRR
jgi:hypothetical protein